MYFLVCYCRFQQYTRKAIVVMEFNYHKVLCGVSGDVLLVGVVGVVISCDKCLHL